MSQNTYQRQLSPIGARIIAGGMGLVMALTGLMFMLVAAIFAQIILVVCLLIILTAVIRYRRSRRIELADGTSGLFSGWAIGGALVGWMFLLPQSWRLPSSLLSLIFDRAEVEMIIMFHLGEILLVELVAVLFLIRMTLHRAPEEYWNTGEDIGRGLGAHLAFFGLLWLLWSIFISAPAINLLFLNDHLPTAPTVIHCRHWTHERSRHPELPEKPPLLSKDWWCPEHSVYDDARQQRLNRCHPGPDYRPVRMIIFLLGALPALVLGMGLVRRGTYLRSLRNQIDNIPTAKCRSVAAGLAELQGKAMPRNAANPGPVLNYSSETPDRNRLNPFLLTDETGAVEVELPEMERPDSDDRIDLQQHGRRRGPLVEWCLRPEDEIYILGDFIPHVGQDGTYGRIRPWSPARQSLLVDLTSPLLDETMAIGNWSLARLLGLGRLNGIFILSDSGETGVRRYMTGRWKLQIAAGAFTIIGGMGLILTAV